jgi:hypothetical protein
MRHIRQIDGEDHTVIMVQVENETGILGAPRDHCSLAEAAFAAPVPAELTRYLQAHSEALVPELRAAWDAAATHSGAWAQVFGNVADEAFMAWHIGRYVDEVTAAGQAEYALPMYANAWLVQHEFQAPGQYPSGGPVSRMLNVWQCAAPHINLCAPDIYLPDFAGICKSYTQAGNALFIPEAHHDETAGAHGFYAVGQYDALGFSPFGIESMNAAETEVYTEANRLLADMMPLLCAAQGTGNMVGVLQGDELVSEVILGGYTLRIRFSRERAPGRMPGAGLIIANAPDEFIVAGHGFGVDFSPLMGAESMVDFLWLYEGDYRQGQWIPGRRLNGDEYALRLPERASVQRARVYRYE